MNMTVIKADAASIQNDENVLAGKVIAITGAYGGLGQEVATAVACAGATVVLMGYRERPLNKIYDQLVAMDLPTPAVAPVNLESATPDDYAELMGIIQSELGGLDGLVHAAAFFDGLTPVSHYAPDEWLRSLQVNLSAPFALTQAAMPLLEKAEDSAVVFITDDGQEVGSANWGAYGVAKAGLERLAGILHEETEHSPIRVNMLLPAPMRTALRRKAWFGENTMRLPTPDTAAKAIVRMLSAQGRAWRGKIVRLT